MAVGGAEEETEKKLEELRDERRGLLVLHDALRSMLDLHSVRTFLRNNPQVAGGIRVEKTHTTHTKTMESISF
jgi:hypothetical protein